MSTEEVSVVTLLPSFRVRGSIRRDSNQLHIFEHPTDITVSNYHTHSLEIDFLIEVLCKQTRPSQTRNVQHIIHICDLNQLYG